jgi:hypothetical protein
LPANTSEISVNPVTFPPGSREAINQPKRNRIRYAKKNDGYRSGSVLSSYGSRRPGRDEHVNFETDQLIGQGREPVELIISVSIVESDVLTLNIAERTELWRDCPDRRTGTRI